MLILPDAVSQIIDIIYHLIRGCTGDTFRKHVIINLCLRRSLLAFSTPGLTCSLQVSSFSDLTCSGMASSTYGLMCCLVASSISGQMHSLVDSSMFGLTCSQVAFSMSGLMCSLVLHIHYLSNSVSSPSSSIPDSKSFRQPQKMNVHVIFFSSFSLNWL